MIQLQNIKLARQPDERSAKYPFNVPIVRALAERDLVFKTPVTFFVGENGSGKSTMLEAIACAAHAITVGSDGVEHDATLDAVRLLARALKLSWRAKRQRGFYMRSEDFFGFVKWTRDTRAAYERELSEVDAEFAHRSETARNYTRLPFLKELGALKQRYGDDLDAHSHGETYFKLFGARFVPNGLYLLDEPEAPLSPMRQLGLLTMIKTQVEEHSSQFVIATHAPILLAYPGATIYSFDGGAIKTVAYDDLEHVQFTRAFLANPQRYLRHL